MKMESEDLHWLLKSRDVSSIYSSNLLKKVLVLQDKKIISLTSRIIAMELNVKISRIPLW